MNALSPPPHPRHYVESYMRLAKHAGTIGRRAPRLPRTWFPLVRLRATLLLLAALLAACTAPGANAPRPTTTSVEPTPGVTLVLWHGWYGADREALARLVDGYNRANPAARVRLQPIPLASFAAELRTAVAGGAGPHLALVPSTWIGELAAAGTLLPLDDLLNDEDRAAHLPAALAGAQAQVEAGALQLYGLPVRFDTLALFYNTANLSAAPADSATLLTSARGLSAPEATPPVWGLALNLSLDNTIGYLYAFGGRVFDDDGQLVLGAAGRAGTERWLAWLQALNADEQILARADSSIRVEREVNEGRALMTFDWSYQLPAYRVMWGPNLGIAPLPALNETGDPPRPYVRSDILTVNSRASAAERQAALAFLRFLAGEQAQQELLAAGIQPSRTVLLDGDTPLLAAARAFRAQAETGLPMPNTPARALVEHELKLMQRQVLLGLATPADAVSEADRRLRERLAVP
jgi:ABC-type glycerol-3-phosphate transport system substrate-binding protein